MSLKKLKTQFNDLVTPPDPYVPPAVPKESKAVYFQSTLYANTSALPALTASTIGTYAFVGTTWDSGSRKLYFADEVKNAWVDTGWDRNRQIQNVIGFRTGAMSSVPHKLYSASSTGLKEITHVPYSQTTDLGNVSGNVDLSDYNGYKITMSLTGATIITDLPDYCSLFITPNNEYLNIDKKYIIWDNEASEMIGGQDLIMTSSGLMWIEFYLEVKPYIMTGFGTN
jgi:hypothetical protein